MTETREYEKYEYCKDVECVALCKDALTGVDYCGEEHIDYCKFTVKEILLWAHKNGFKILKDI